MSTEPNNKSSTSNQKRPANPVTVEGERPQKRFYRQRAHCNPLSHNDAFGYPLQPDDMDWTGHNTRVDKTISDNKDEMTKDTTTNLTTEKSEKDNDAETSPMDSSKTADNHKEVDDTDPLNTPHYPNLPAGATPNILDIGCGFGGLTMALATLLPNDVILGMEIRAKVTEYIRLRILNARREHASDGSYQNCSVLRTNSMKFLPNYFRKASIDKMFFCFPDPHFKRKNHPRRIISERLLAEYTFVLKPGVGRLYCITDVAELHEWHVRKCDAHPLLERIHDTNRLNEDSCVQAMRTATEEGQKVQRNGGQKYYAVYQRLVQPKTKQDLSWIEHLA
jgi:tRNA (guanine-N(7)-)-methyltransferase